MREPVVRYVPRRDVTPKAELNTLASVYRFLIERHAEKTVNKGRLKKPRGGVDGTLGKQPQEEK